MKLEESYAQALVLSIKGKDTQDKNKILKHFFELISRKGHSRLLSRIANAVERVESREAEKNIVKIYVRNQGKETLSKETVLLFEKERERPIYETCEDGTLIGGYVVKGKGIRVDASYKNALLSLYTKIKV